MNAYNSVMNRFARNQVQTIKKVQEYVKAQSEKLGRPLTANITTFGCQMNARDSEKLVGILEKIGYVEAPDEKADFVIYNTCTCLLYTSPSPRDS